MATTPATWTADEHLDPAHLNSRITDVNIDLAKPPYATLWGSPSYTYTGASSVGGIRFTSSLADRMTVTTSGSNKAGVKVAEAGWYSIELTTTAEVGGGTPDSHFIVFITVNGTFVGRGIVTARNAYQQTAFVHRLLDLKAGDVITASVFTDKGRVVTFGSSEAMSAGCRLSVLRVSSSPWSSPPALPALKSWQLRELVTAEAFNQQVRDVQKWLRNPPLFTAARTKSVTVSGGTAVNLPWNTADLNGFIAVKNSSGEITGFSPKTAGRYLIHGQVCGKLDKSLGHLCLYLKVNGTTKGMGVAQYENAAYMDSAMSSVIVSLRTSDVISTDVYVSSGRVGNITGTAEQQLASGFLGYRIGA
ncbi:hypothetical protein [Streptomyces sp. NPDC014733]|uniref:hypothetical protein n=1 Tax=Streptomyces sp. NPDC014733 TaxID=3364885 RepID=UPI0036FEE5A4